MTLRKNAYRVGRQQERFGQRVVVTDNVDWTTAQVVAASLELWQVGYLFQQSKQEESLRARPVQRWTDGKFRRHFLACVAAMM